MDRECGLEKYFIISNNLDRRIKSEQAEVDNLYKEKSKCIFYNNY